MEGQTLLEYFLGPQDGLQMGPVWDSFLLHLRDGFGTHFGVALERLKCSTKQQNGALKSKKETTLWDQNINERSQAMGGTRA